MRGFSSVKTIYAVAFLAAASLLPTAGVAAQDALIEGGRLCTQQFPIQEQRNNIPTHLLAAISTTESGRWHEGLGMAVPWPWTINVEGKGYYFNSKAEAIAQTQRLLAQGHQSIDVGCMQVNLKHHAKAFANLDEAFDPAANVAYAAKFLHDNYAELGDWIKATAAYHSRTQVYGQRYLVDIERAWNRIVAKVAAARASQGGAASSVETARAEPSAAPAMQARTVKMNPIPSTHNVQMVKVSSDDKPLKAADVLVIRGATPITHPMPVTAATASFAPVTPTPQVVASAAPVAPQDVMLIKPAGDSVRRVTLDNPASSSQLKDASQPKFVFAN